MSRKITEAAVNAFLAGRDFRRANTTVYYGRLGFDSDEYWYLELHGNPIARFPAGRNFVDEGEIRNPFDSKTTQERLNGLPGVSVFTHKYEVWLNGRPWDRMNEWTPTKGQALPTLSKFETECRDLAFEFIKIHSEVNIERAKAGLNPWDFWSFGTIRSRRGKRKGDPSAPVLRYDLVKADVGIEVRCRPWQEKPEGEIKGPGGKVTFDSWSQFIPMIDKALQGGA